MFLKMIKSGDPNPHDFIYPSLYYYVNALIYLLYYGFGRLFGAFKSLTDLVEPVLLMGGSGKTALPWLFLSGRSLSVVLGVATAALTFDLGRRITGLVLGGVLAGLWVAFSPTLVANSRFLIPDGPLAFFTTLVVWAAWRIYQDGRTRDYLLAGVALGLAVGLKYNAAVFALAIVAAHFLRDRLARAQGLAAVWRGGDQLCRLRGDNAVRDPGLTSLFAGRVYRHPSLYRRARRKHRELAGVVPGVLLADRRSRAGACSRRSPLGRLQTLARRDSGRCHGPGIPAFHQCVCRSRRAHRAAAYPAVCGPGRLLPRQPPARSDV